MLATRVARVLTLLFFLLAAPLSALAAPPKGGSAGTKAPAASAPAAVSDATAEVASDTPSAGEPDVLPTDVLKWQPGPLKVNLGHEIDLDLPAAYVFLGMPDAAKLLEKLGNFHNENLLGLVISKEEATSWFVTIRYDESGFIKDDEKLDADELLEAIRGGTEEANEERVKRGFKALHVDDWRESPRYEKSLHHLVWALNAHDDESASVNFNTRVLGRRGYVSLNLVTEPKELSAHKLHAAALLAETRFRGGARYEDFDEKTDKVAEYGLIGLVLGGAGLGAAKLVKVGLLAKFGKVILAVLIAGKKALIPLFAGLAALGKWLFSKKKTTSSSDE